MVGHGTSGHRGDGVRAGGDRGKHFPGLGQVTANTDTAAGVTDTVTTAHDADMAPFAASAAGAPCVMVSPA